MTPEIHKQFNQINGYIQIMGGVLSVVDVEFLKKFEEEARPWANGTMSPILGQDMGVRDLQTSEKNLTHAIEVSRQLRKLISLLTTESPNNAK